MNRDLQNMLRLLHGLNITLRQRLELAEIVIPALNTQISQLMSVGVIPEQAMFGDIIHQMAYDLGGPTDSGIVFQAVLRVPGGIGTLLLDTEEYADVIQSQEGLEIYAATKFVPFADCNPAIKALLLPQVEVLLTRLVTQLGRHLKVGADDVA